MHTPVGTVDRRETGSVLGSGGLFKWASEGIFLGLVHLLNQGSHVLELTGEGGNERFTSCSQLTPGVMARCFLASLSFEAFPSPCTNTGLGNLSGWNYRAKILSFQVILSLHDLWIATYLL